MSQAAPICPCGHEFEFDDYVDLISYWGDVGSHRLDCPLCDRVLNVTEKVVRTFDVVERPRNDRRQRKGAKR